MQIWEEEKVMCVGADLFMGLLLLDPTLLNHLFILMVKVLPFDVNIFFFQTKKIIMFFF